MTPHENTLVPGLPSEHLLLLGRQANGGQDLSIVATLDELVEGHGEQLAQ